jgi:hypothetical protein
VSDASGVWELFDRARWVPAAGLDPKTIPENPGVYAWRRAGEVVYLGVAKTSLRQRLRAHLATVPDLSRSTLRASVAVQELGVDRATARARPAVISVEQAEVVNAWLRGCDVAWVAQGSADSAVTLEGRLLRQRKPPLNRAG